MDYKIHVGSPALIERTSIINSTIPILFRSPDEQGLFTQELINHISKKAEGFSGRDLFKLINRLKTEVQMKRILDPKAIDRVIERFVRQEHQVEHLKFDSPLKQNQFYKTAKAGG